MNRRRDFLAFTAGTAALGMVLPAAASASTATELDGELIACSAEFLAVCRRLEAVWDEAEDLPERDPRRIAADREDKLLSERYSALIDRMTALPARTPEGLRAKGEFLLCYLSNGGCESKVAASLACDVTGQVGWQSPFEWERQS